MRIRILTGPFALALWLVLLAGCGAEDEPLTKSERQRLMLDARVKQFMLEGEEAYRAGNYAAALALSDSAETYAPDLADIHFFRGRIYTDLNQLDVANAAYEAALAIDPEYQGAHMNLGINHARRGELRDAVGRFRREEALAPRSDLYLELGRAYAKLGQADSARAAYEEAIALDSLNTTAIMWLGQLYEEMGDFDKALEYSRRGATLRPENLDYKYIIGSQLFRMGQVDESVAYLQPVAEARPWHHGAQYNLGQAYLRLGREDDAQRFLDRANAAQQLQQSINEAQDVINREPDRVENWIRLGEAHRKGGMYDRAASAFKVAVTITPWDLNLQTNLATLLMEGGDAEGAIRRYRAVLARDATMTQAWLNLGVAYGNAGRYEEARQAWREVLRQEPRNPDARAYLAQLDELTRAL